MIVVRHSWLAAAVFLILVSGCSSPSQLDTKVKAITKAADQFTGPPSSMP